MHKTPTKGSSMEQTSENSRDISTSFTNDTHATSASEKRTTITMMPPDQTDSACNKRIFKRSMMN